MMVVMLRMMMNSIFVVIVVAGRGWFLLRMDSIPSGEIEGDRFRDRGGTVWRTVRGLLGITSCIDATRHRQERGRLPDDRRRSRGDSGSTGTGVVPLIHADNLTHRGSERQIDVLIATHLYRTIHRAGRVRVVSSDAVHCR
uniref:Putative secreted protein n=1 Tax=Anopheles darlingi TaxID=43151 RepID=A0A2M4DL36_ANODA